MEPSGLQLRAVSPRQDGGIAARRPPPASLFANRSRYANEPPGDSSALPTYREDHRGRRSKAHDRNRDHPSDDLIDISQYEKRDLEVTREIEPRLVTREDLEATWEELARRDQMRGRGNLSRQRSVSSMSHSSAVSGTTVSTEGHYVAHEYLSDSPLSEKSAPETTFGAPRFSDRMPGATKQKPKLALFSRANKGLLGSPESEASMSTTISRDNTAGERARHASLLAEYGRKIKPTAQPGPGLPRPRPSPSPTPKSTSRPSDDRRADRSPSPTQEENDSSWSAKLSEHYASFPGDRLAAARDYIRRAREVP